MPTAHPVNENISIGVVGECAVAPQSTRSGSFGADNLNADAKGRFFAGPLPLGGTYTVTVRRGHCIQLSSPVLLDAAHPTIKLTLRLPPTTAVEGRVLDGNGRPIPGVALELEFAPSAPSKQGGNSWAGDLRTDQEGCFRISDLGVGIGRYWLNLRPNRDFCPMRLPLPLDGKPLDVQLKRGHILTGQLLDDVTGRPIADAVMVAMPSDHSSPNCEAEGLTDTQGKFRFSNLDDREYQIVGRDGLEPSPSSDSTWSPGQKSITMRVKIPKWSSLKPQPR